MYTRLKKSHKPNEREGERERERENSARSAPLLKRLKRRGKSCFLSLFLSSSLALTQTTAPKKRFDLSFFLFPFSSGIVVSRARRFLSFSLFFSSRLSSETRRDRAFRDIYIYIHARARDQREVRRMNTPSEKKEKRRSAERSALSLTRILIWKGKDKKRGGRKNLPRLFFSSSVWHIFFFLLCICLFSSFSFMKFFSLATMKNVLLWGKGLRQGRTTKGHRDEEEGGNDQDNKSSHADKREHRQHPSTTIPRTSQPTQCFCLPLVWR